MMSINESYYSVKARKIIGESGSKETHIVHELEPQEEIDRCLNCQYSDCTDTCPYSPGYRKPKQQKDKSERERLTAHERYAKKIDENTRKRAKNVSLLFLDGWSVGGIAWKLGLTRSETEESLKHAEKLGLLKWEAKNA